MAAEWLQKLVDDGIISDDQLVEADEMAAGMGVKTEEALIKQGYVAASVVGRAQAEHFGYQYLEMEGTEIPPSVIEMVPESVARENVVIPLSLEDDALVVAPGEARTGRLHEIC